MHIVGTIHIWLTTYLTFTRLTNQFRKKHFLYRFSSMPSPNLVTVFQSSAFLFGHWHFAAHTPNTTILHVHKGWALTVKSVS